MQAIILAAGQSSRFWPLAQGKHKSQIKILGKPLIQWTIEGLVKKGVKEIIVIHKPNSSLESELGDGSKFGVKLNYVIQNELKGTGDAIFQARSFIREPFFVLHPSKVGIGDCIDLIIQKFHQENPEAVLVGAPTDFPEIFGMLDFYGDKVRKICEKPTPGSEPSNIKSLGVYLFTPRFFDYYQRVARREEDLVNALNLLMQERDARVVLLDEELPSFKYPWHVFEIAKSLFHSSDFKNYISPSAKISKNISINGPVFIGDEAEIKDNVVINGPCYIGKKCKIGANTVLREYTNLENEVIVGALAEIKNSVFQEGIHVHSGYFGNSIIGANCRLGAGFITANRRIDRASIKVLVKGKKINSNLTYLGTIIGDNTRVGIHVSVMPGVLIGSNCVIGPNSLVMRNIEDDTTFYTKHEEVKKKKTVLD